MSQSLLTPQQELAVRYLTGALSDHPAPKAVTPVGQGGKFDPEGQVLPFPGNTFLCHIDRRSDEFAVLSELQAALRTLPSASYYAFLPPESFHMTVFCGISGVPLGSDGWPNGVPTNASLQQVTDLWLPKLETLQGFSRLDIRATHLEGGNSLRVAPVTEAGERLVRGVRDGLRDLTALDRSNHASYEFHISLAYLLKWMPPDLARQTVVAADEIFDAFAGLLQEIQLGPIEFCSFQNMYWFDTIRLLPVPPVSLPVSPPDGT